MAGGALIEETLKLWASSLRAAKARMRPLFMQERMAASAGLFLDGLLGGRTSQDRRRVGGGGRSRSLAPTGDPGARAVRCRRPARHRARLCAGDVGRCRRRAGDRRDRVASKQGKASCGVGRQYTGPAGKITNCQVGVFAAYASRHGHAFVDRALYLPKAWTNDPARLAAAHVPDEVTAEPQSNLLPENWRLLLACSGVFWISRDGRSS